MSLKILITGANGQLGSELQRLLKTGRAEIGSIPSYYDNVQVIATDAQELDITDQKLVFGYIKKGGFDLVINCAAMTDVDGCETHEDAALRINADAPGFLARAVHETQAKFVQVSTDYVFSGEESRPRLETDATNPVSAYGRSKLEGERQVMKYCSRSFVVRTAWLYGYVGNNFVKTMMKLGAKHREVTVVDDQLGNPTSANDVAYEILKIASGDAYGIYHCTNKGTCSWANFAQAIMAGAARSCRVIPCSSEEYARKNPAAAMRPEYSSLRNKHLEDTIGDEMRPWSDALASYFKNLPLLKD